MSLFIHNQKKIILIILTIIVLAGVVYFVINKDLLVGISQKQATPSGQSAHVLYGGDQLPPNLPIQSFFKKAQTLESATDNSGPKPVDSVYYISEAKTVAEVYNYYLDYLKKTYPGVVVIDSQTLTENHGYIYARMLGGILSVAISKNQTDGKIDVKLNYVYERNSSKDVFIKLNK